MDPSLPPSRDAERLRPGVLTTADVIAQSFAFLGPVTGAAFVTTLVAQSAGYATPLVVVAAGLLCVSVGYVLAQLAGRIHHAGCIYEYVNQSFGPAAGAVAGWVYFVGLALFTPAVLYGVSGWLCQFAESYFGARPPWYPTALLLCIPLYLLALYEIRIATRTQLAITLASVGAVSLVLLWILLRGGASGHSLGPFLPSGSPRGWSGLSFGLLFALLFFAGFESSATLAEETADPKRTLPRAVLGSVAVTALFYVAVTYTYAIGFGRAGAEEWGREPEALMALSGRYVGAWLPPLMFLTAIVDAFAVVLGCLTAASRVGYALARDRLLPAGLARVHPKHRTPNRSAAAILLVSAALGLPFLLAGQDAMVPFGYINGIASILFQAIYVTAMVGALVFFRRLPGKEYSAARHLAAPLVATLGCGAALYGSLQAPEDPLLRTMPYVAAGLAASGLVLAPRGIRRRAVPGPADRASAASAQGRPSPAEEEPPAGAG